MSRCTTRCACAWATAVRTLRNRRTRAGTSRLTIVAVGVDVLAFDVLEDDIGLAGWRDAGVDQVGDRRMRQPREDRAFANEPFFSAAPNQRGVEELDRRGALESPVAAAGKPHAPHAARADTRDERVRTDDLTGERRGACESAPPCRRGIPRDRDPGARRAGSAGPRQSKVRAARARSATDRAGRSQSPAHRPGTGSGPSSVRGRWSSRCVTRSAAPIRSRGADRAGSSPSSV